MYLTKFGTKLYATNVRFIRWASLLQVSKWDSIFFHFNNEAIETSRFRQLLWLQYAGHKIFQNVNYTQRGTMEGPERGTEARSAGLPRARGLGRGAIAPPQYGVWGHCPQKILKFNSADLFIFSTISKHFATSHNTLQQSQLHTWQGQLHTLRQKTHNFRPWQYVATLSCESVDMFMGTIWAVDLTLNSS